MAPDLLQRRSGTTTLIFITTQEEEYETANQNYKLQSLLAQLRVVDQEYKGSVISWKFTAAAKLLTRFNICTRTCGHIIFHISMYQSPV